MPASHQVSGTQRGVVLITPGPSVIADYSLQEVMGVRPGEDLCGRPPQGHELGVYRLTLTHRTCLIGLHTF